jgi:hypothetical protein
MVAFSSAPIIVPFLVAAFTGLFVWRLIFHTPSWWWLLLPGVPLVTLLPFLVYFILSLRGLARL